jgi:NAD(P)-dependent dehydrogenase (short-subunit alcohol dehydrogenase family)
VLITGRGKDALDRVAASHDLIEAFQADSAEPESAVAIVAEALRRWGQIDLLVNNAGGGGIMTMPDYNAERIDLLARLNITAPSLLTKEAAPHLRESRGAIVNVTTAVARGASPLTAHYAATKLALEHLTLSWAIELAESGIRVNAVAPGPVKSNALTGMMGLPPEKAREVEAIEAQQVPLGRRGQPGDIAEWIIALGGPGDRWITGQVVTVDGGWSVRL